MTAEATSTPQPPVQAPEGGFAVGKFIVPRGGVALLLAAELLVQTAFWAVVDDVGIQIWKSISPGLLGLWVYGGVFLAPVLMAIAVALVYWRPRRWYIQGGITLVAMAIAWLYWSVSAAMWAEFIRAQTQPGYLEMLKTIFPYMN